MSVPAGLLAAFAIAACGPSEDPPLECVDPGTISTMCAPLYPPTFDNVYTMTLAPKCGSQSSSCHSDRGHKGGMSFSTIDGAHAELLEAEQMRVVPGDPACSEMIIRTTATNFSIVMPPGGIRLIDAETCALIQWVANGAVR